MEEVEEAGADIDATVQRLAGHGRQESCADTQPERLRFLPDSRTLLSAAQVLVRWTDSRTQRQAL